MIALALALLLQAAETPRASDPIPGIDVRTKAASDPIPGVPGTAATKPKHDTAKNAIGNVRAETGDPIPGVPPTPSPRPPAAAKDVGKPVACVPSPTKTCPKDASSSPT